MKASLQFMFHPGVIDNSGLRFFYTTEEPELRAGAIFLGHAVTNEMIVPPSTGNYTVTGICTADCTGTVRNQAGLL